MTMDPLSQEKSSHPSPASAAPGQQSVIRAVRPWLRSKKMWCLVAVLMVLLAIGTWVPVSKIPFLRNLVYAMGYTPDETKNLSLLKALFSWNDHSKMMRGELPDPDEASILSSGGSLTAASLQAQGQLINVRSVNASLARRGQKGDYLSGVYNPPQGMADPSGGVRVENTKVSAATQANGSQLAEVFFGEDSSAIARDKNDAFDSTNTLKKVANRSIAGSTRSTDWFEKLVDKAVRSEADLSGLMEGKNNTKSTLANVGSAGKIGDSRAKRDLYYAWLTGRAARRTPQVILKKTLAAAGFNGAEMPRSVFTASGFSGVGIKPDDVVADMDSVKKYLELDKQCQQALSGGQGKEALMEDTYQKIDSLPGSFPATCGDVGNSGFMTKLTGLASNCKQLRKSYEQVQKGCATITLNLQDSQCKAEKLTSYYVAFAGYCLEKEKACQSAGTPEQQAQCRKEVAALSSAQDYTEPGSNISYNSNELKKDVEKTFYDGDALNQDYFPGVDWGRSLWVDGSMAD